MSAGPELVSPKGDRLPAPHPPEAGERLTDWLARNGHSLNTRCGQRGLCRGCEVVELGSQQRLRACQVKVDAFDGLRLQIPAASLRDRSLTGVSAFDLDPAFQSETCGLGAGLAVDVGTTTLAASLWAGHPARCLGTRSCGNPQIPFGDNVVSRIHYSIEKPEGIRSLQRVLVEEGMVPLLRGLCEAADLDPAELERVTVTGNPAMLHTLAGESLRGLASYPFDPVFLELRELSGELLGLPADCRIQLLPGPGPFVGSDVLAGALACGLFRHPGPSLLIDFGTNGEILLRTPQGNYCTATAAGPAFEGGRLECGAVAGTGVISRFRAGPDGEWMAEGSGEPWHGIAGAAYVDFLALALAGERLTPSGRFRNWGRDGRGAPAPGVRISEADVAELLQAKAAIQGGWKTLLDEAGLRASDLHRLELAGGFGYHLTPKHAAAIGLIPDLPPDHIHLAGNSSLGGACLCLLRPELIQELTTHCAEMRVVELNQTDSFEDHYIDALTLGPADVE